MKIIKNKNNHIYIRRDIFDYTNSDEMIGKFRVGMNLLLTKFMSTEDHEWHSRNKILPIDIASEE